MSTAAGFRIILAVGLAFALTGCGTSEPSRSAEDAEKYLSVQLESLGRQLGVTFSEVSCSGSGSSFECNAFNSLNGEVVYDVAYSDGEWEHHARG